MDNFEVIKEWLKTHCYITVPDDWLQACLEWLQEEHQDQYMECGVLQQLVYHQWLSSDLRVLGVGCLPADICQREKTVLHGPFCLQVDSMVDVGSSFYSQIQKCRGTENTNATVTANPTPETPWEPKPTRMMMSSMTDGITDVKGIEYIPMPLLTNNYTPGFKVCVAGEVVCRRGVFFLHPKNTTLLGGEVETDAGPHHPTAMLERLLSTETSQDTQPLKKEFSGRMLSRGSNSDAKVANMVSSKTNRKFRHCSDSSMQSSEIAKSKINVCGNDNSVTSFNVANEDGGITCQTVSSHDFSDDLNMMEDDDFFDSVEAEQLDIGYKHHRANGNNSNASGLPSSTNGRTNVGSFNTVTKSFVRVQPNNSQSFADCMESNDDSVKDFVTCGVYKRKYDDSSEINDEDTRSFRSPRLDSEITGISRELQVTGKESGGLHPQSVRPILTNTSVVKDASENGSFRGDVDGVRAIRPMDSGMKREVDSDGAVMASSTMRSQSDRKSTVTNVDPFAREPFTYLILVEHLLTLNIGKCFKIKAYISTVLGQLKSSPERGWSLPCRLNDGTSTVDVQLSDALLSRMIGSTSQLDVQSSSENTTRIEQLTQAIRACQRRLINLTCIFTLEVVQNMEIQVKQIEQISHSHIELLQLALDS